MNISGPFIRRPIGTTLLAAGMAVVGVICYFLLGVAALPNMEFPAIFVTASQPGASADTMASTVAAPLERHLGQIPGIDSMSSRSSEGSASVIMIFQTGRKVDSAARDVQAAINAAAPDLPSGLTNAPTYRKANPNAQPVRCARADVAKRSRCRNSTISPTRCLPSTSVSSMASPMSKSPAARRRRSASI